MMYTLRYKKRRTLKELSQRDENWELTCRVDGCPPESLLNIYFTGECKRRLEVLLIRAQTESIGLRSGDCMGLGRV
ncbi:hypothetical protein TNCV_2481831 [Trichonephila clavipes]|nr:hypothetical protein TNCV_2481831 [Trichonephila clavipes]